MATQGLSKYLPTRASKDHRSHVTRQRSRNAREVQREINRRDNESRRKANIDHGYTGKQLDNAIRRWAGIHGESYRWVKSHMNEQTELYIASDMGLI